MQLLHGQLSRVSLLAEGSKAEEAKDEDEDEIAKAPSFRHGSPQREEVPTDDEEGSE